MRFEYAEKTERLADPVATTGSRLYCICTQNGDFPDPPGGHIAGEMWGIWAHPIKLFDGFRLAIHPSGHEDTAVWLTAAAACRVHGTHTEFAYQVGDLRITRSDVVPEDLAGMIVTVSLSAPPGVEPLLEITALFRSDLRPAWLGERVGMVDAPDTVHADLDGGVLLFDDRDNPWATVVGSSVHPLRVATAGTLFAGWTTTGEGTAAALTCPLIVDASGTATVRFFLAGSAESADEARATLARLMSDHGRLIEAKRELYAAVAARSALETPDALVDRAFHWVKLNGQMLTLEVPPLGRGLAPAGSGRRALGDAPRRGPGARTPLPGAAAPQGQSARRSRPWRARRYGQPGSGPRVHLGGPSPG